ncbi:hypothetical protein PSTT_02084 [Puccinia striiformis]|uniref:Uncharacterized protein n=1 Tax=Puccinia striiformis TaxID=27350 RepID=A0A2S4W121_9BASI|nr:hypothetical protein PSTT_02084 [Puccinia striiformis]
MLSNILPSIVLVLSASRLSNGAITPTFITEAARGLSSYLATLSHAPPPPSPHVVSISATPGHFYPEYDHLRPNPNATPLHEYFLGDATLEDVAGLQASMFPNHHNNPISRGNMETWIEDNQEYQALEDKQQAKIRSWLKQFFVDEVDSRLIREKATSFIWSLKQSSRAPDTIWWDQDLVEKNSANMEYISLVTIGDYLQFYDRESFKTTHEKVEEMTPKILQILSLDQNNELRKTALTIKELLKYKDSRGLRMYEDRMGEVISVLLKDFSTQNIQEKQDALHNLYIVFGTAPSKAKEKARNAIRNDPTLSPIFEHPHPDSRALNKRSTFVSKINYKSWGSHIRSLFLQPKRKQIVLPKTSMQKNTPRLGFVRLGVMTEFCQRFIGVAPSLK